MIWSLEEAKRDFKRSKKLCSDCSFCEFQDYNHFLCKVKEFCAEGNTLNNQSASDCKYYKKKDEWSEWRNLDDFKQIDKIKLFNEVNLLFRDIEFRTFKLDKIHIKGVSRATSTGFEILTNAHEEHNLYTAQLLSWGIYQMIVGYTERIYEN